MLVKGADYRIEEVVGREVVEAAGGDVLLVDLVPGHSTTRPGAPFGRVRRRRPPKLRSTKPANRDPDKSWRRDASLAMLAGFDRSRWAAVADWLAVGVAVTLPWSTTATAIFIALWLLAVLPTLDAASLRRELTTAAGFLPVLLWVLAAIGMLWADVSLAERLGGLGKFHRLLLIPLLFTHFRRSERGIWVLYGFFAASVLRC